MIGLAVAFIAPKALAQQAFAEGVITYAVTLEPPANQEGVTQYSGTYTITIKGLDVRKELVLNNGFKATILTDGGKLYTLREAQGAQYAIQLDPQDMEARTKKYAGYRLMGQDNVPEIAGLPATFTNVVYPDGSRAELIYTTQWTVATDLQLFERLPGLTQLPLSYRQRNEDGTAMFFKATSVAETPVAGSVFKIPVGYKIITSEEYKKLTNR